MTCSSMKPNPIHYDLLAGGFLLIDDFRGSWAWESLANQMQQVFPNRDIRDVPPSHLIFNLVFDVEEIKQVPNYQNGIDFERTGITFEEDGRRPRVRGIFDDADRLMLLINSIIKGTEGFNIDQYLVIVQPMEILFLGTSAGVPTKTRNVSAIALIDSVGSAWHLVDCGEGTQHQILNSPLSLNTLSSIFITHLHGDHCYGLPGLLASAGLNGRRKTLTIVAPDGARQWLALTQKMSELHLPFALEFITPGDVTSCSFDQFSVSSITLSHRISSFGYAFTEKNVSQTLSIEKINSKGIPQSPLWGKVQAGYDIEFEGTVYESKVFCDAPRPPRKIIICGDNAQPDLLANECQNCDVLVHESTFAENMSARASSVGHTYSKAIASFAQSVSIPNLILTHISARYSDYDPILENEAKQLFSGKLFVARDFDRYRLNTTGELNLLKPNQ